MGPGPVLGTENAQVHASKLCAFRGSESFRMVKRLKSELSNRRRWTDPFDNVTANSGPAGFGEGHQVNERISSEDSKAWCVMR